MSSRAEERTRYWTPAPPVCSKCDVRHYANTACPKEPRVFCAGHMQYFVEASKLRQRVRLSVKALSSHEFDGLAFSGMSGAFIGPIVAMRMRKSILLVRKPNDTTHSDYQVEGDVTVKRYIIIDDFICSGQTRRFIMDSVSEFAPRAECLGLLSVNTLAQELIEMHRGREYPLDQIDTI